jgi:hypothetical protein
MVSASVRRGNTKSLLSVDRSDKARHTVVLLRSELDGTDEFAGFAVAAERNGLGASRGDVVFEDGVGR